MKRCQLFRPRIGTALLFCALAQSALADATFVVNDQTDAVDNNIGDGVCLAANGKCTLRAAIQEANARFAADPGTLYTITVPGGTIISDPKVYALTLTGSGEDNAATGDLDIKSNLLIQGTGAGALVSAAQLGDRVFHIIQPPSGPINVTFINIWIANGTGVNGSSDGRLGGGGLLIDNAGSVTLMDGRVVSNSVTIPSTQTGLGGGIFQNTRGGKLTLKNMLVGNNRLLGGDQSVGAGGGVFGFGALSVSDSTIVSNVVTFNALLGSSTSFSGEGGGIQISCCVGNDSLTLSNTAVLSNTVSVRGPTASAQFAFGGGVYGAAPLTITNSTVQGNLVQATGNVNNVQGGGVHADGALLMQKSTVTENRLLTASNASVIFAGGGVRVSSAGSILTSTITRNTIRIGSAFGGSGGGLSVGNTSNHANVQVDASSVEYNLASNGGGIETHSSDSTLAVRNSVVDNNTGLTGGGILNTGILSLTNSTIYSNLSWNHGGGLYNNGTANVDNVTFNNNTADIDQDNAGDGGAIYVLNGATLFLRNSLLTGNTDDSPSGTHAPECFGDIISQDYNLIAQTPSPSVCNVIGSTGHNLIGIFPNVLSTTLQDNGGPTPTLELPPGSAAIDAGDDSVLGPPLNLAADQRGYPRKVGAHVDIGALETGPVQAGETLTVTNTAEHDDGSCTTDDCTLLEAINAANANADVSTINFAPGVSGVILNTLMPNGLSITKPVTINGPGASVLTISGNHASRVFTVSPGAVVNFNGLTIANGSSSTNGGGIFNDHGTVTLTNCVVTGNTANFGGGIFNWGSTSGTASLTINNSTLNANAASGASGKGGGIYNEGVSSGTALLSLTNCTVSDNTAVNIPGTAAIENSGSSGTARATLTNCTFNGNAIANDSATLLLANTLLAASPGANLVNSSGAITSQGHNLSSDAGGGFLTAAGDQINTDPLFDPAGLASNGGPTRTIALLSNSPAINNGDDSQAPVTDQRGYYRSGVSDIGAFEFGGIVPVLPTVTTDAATNITTTTATLNATVNPNGLSTTVQFVTDFATFPAQAVGSGTTSGAVSLNVTGLAPNTQYHVSAVATNAAGTNTGVDQTFTTLPAPTPTPTATPTSTPGLVANVATRLPVGTGDDVLIEGFIVQGPAGSAKKIIVRALGPFLTQFGIVDALANPTLEIHDAGNATIATNNDWKSTQVGGLITGDQSAEISASQLAPSNDLESAIIADLAPGSYTAVVRGLGNTTGTGIVDAYDISAASPARLVNIATRGLIQPGDKLMIAGFIIQNAPVKAVIRAIGPSLIAFGISNALPDTTLQLRDENGGIILENDNWRTDQEQDLQDIGLQPTNDLEAALIATIPPGQYTAQVRGKNEATGIGVVEVYFLQ